MDSLTITCRDCCNDFNVGYSYYACMNVVLNNKNKTKTWGVHKFLTQRSLWLRALHILIPWVNQPPWKPNLHCYF